MFKFLRRCMKLHFFHQWGEWSTPVQHIFDPELHTIRRCKICGKQEKRYL